MLQKYKLYLKIISFYALVAYNLKILRQNAILGDGGGGGVKDNVFLNSKADKKIIKKKPQSRKFD